MKTKTIALGLGLAIAALLWINRDSGDGEVPEEVVNGKSITFFDREAIPVSPKSEALGTKPDGLSLSPLDLGIILSYPRFPFADPAAPPGMVYIDGDEFKLGVSSQKIAAMIEETGQRPLASEAPIHTMDVANFYLMTTEVTNEQYEVFVRATNAKPPMSWGMSAVQQASFEHLREIGLAKKLARDRGHPIPNLPAFDNAAWWKHNWQTALWSVPPELAAVPVVYIDHAQAQAYAEWAGMRLMSEQEFVVAGRGHTTSAYPWGNEFEPARANTLEANIGKPVEVGQFASGAAHFDATGQFVQSGATHDPDTVVAIHDLVGNVWEWTRSPFVAHPGFKPLNVNLASGRARVGVDSDPEERVAVSASFQMPDLAARLTVRRGTERVQATAAIGMRCSTAATQALTLGANLTQRVSSWLAPGARFDQGKALGITFRTYDRGTAEPSTYARITSAEHISFVPHALDFASLKPLHAAAQGDGLAIGVLSTTLPMLAPELPAGDYHVIWSAGAPPVITDGAVQNLDLSPPGKLELRSIKDDQLRAAIDLPLPFRHGPNTQPSITWKQFSTEQTGSPACELLVLECAFSTHGTLYSTFAIDLPLIFAEGANFEAWGR